MSRKRQGEKDELLESLQRIERLLKGVLKAQLTQTLERELADKNKQCLYGHVGKFSGKELAVKTGVSGATISRILQRWEQLGLVVKERGRYRKVI